MGGYDGNRSFPKWEKACSASCVSGEWSQKKAILIVNVPRIPSVTTVSPLEDWDACSLKSSNPLVCDLPKLPGWFFFLLQTYSLITWNMLLQVSIARHVIAFQAASVALAFKMYPKGRYWQHSSSCTEMYHSYGVELLWVFVSKGKKIHAPINLMGRAMRRCY